MKCFDDLKTTLCFLNCAQTTTHKLFKFECNLKIFRTTTFSKSYGCESGISTERKMYQQLGGP